MTSTALLAVVMTVIVILMVTFVYINRFTSLGAVEPLDGADAIVSPLVSGEEKASLIAEKIEGMALRKLALDPARVDADLDFGTALDGSLQIWLDGECYSSVEDLPDGRVREAISQAVAEFNRQ